MSQQEEVKSLLEAGAHFGHRTSRWNPKMRPYIYTERGGIHIIDLVQTAQAMGEAADFAHRVASGGGQILFVGTKKHIAPAIQRIAHDASMPYVINRWFGGILTNFDTILRRIRYFKKLTAQLENDELSETYNKREITKFQEERDKMAASFSGLANMEELPGALFISDVNNEKTAVREANRLGIPIIALVDSNSDPEPIDYPIPANDDAVKTVSLIATTIAEAATTGASEYASAAKQSKTSAKKDYKDHKDQAAKSKNAGSVTEDNTSQSDENQSKPTDQSAEGNSQGDSANTSKSEEAASRSSKTATASATKSKTATSAESTASKSDEKSNNSQTRQEARQ
ncbi:30S ribosomal protein S2 [Candidatus Saccharibacteria bacterium QS_5_54_17]|nr:MAG: 30S ribosomal protein S2 [Candidatus Saccharibacteria bacterium QS_5_54_17]